MAGKKRYQARERRQRIVYKGACEGDQERLYLKHLMGLIQQCESRNYDVDFNFYHTEGGSPLVVAKRASTIPAFDGQQIRVAIFDHDLKETDFRYALDVCKKEKIFPAYSNLCFDLWLILHKTNFSGCVNHTGQYVPIIRQIYNLPAEADIKKEAIISNILSQIQLADVHQAIRNAFETTRNNSKVGTPCFTDRSVEYYPNPDLLIHQFIDKVLNETGCTCA